MLKSLKKNMNIMRREMAAIIKIKLLKTSDKEKNL